LYFLITPLLPTIVGSRTSSNPVVVPRRLVVYWIIANTANLHILSAFERRSVAGLGPPQILFRKKLAPQEAIHDHFRFFASLRGWFFALPASVSLNGVSGETNFLANILDNIQKSRRFFANLACESVVQAKLLANRPSQSARRNEEPRENRGQLRCCIWIQVFGCQSLCNQRRRRKQGFRPGVRIFIRSALIRTAPGRRCEKLLRKKRRMREATSPDQVALPTSGMTCYGQTIRFVYRGLYRRAFSSGIRPNSLSCSGPGA